MYDTVNIYADFYFNFLIGEFPEDVENYRKTSNFFQYLEDCGLSDGEIYMVAGMVKPKMFLTIEDIPDKIKKDSLIEMDKYYFHKELIVTPPPPGWNTEEDYQFYKEIKVRYTLEDVLDYFIKATGTRADWIARDKEIGSIKYLLKEYKKFKFIEPVDFILHLIDYCVSSNDEINTIYDLRNKEIELAEALEIDIANAVARGKHLTIWRS